MDIDFKKEIEERRDNLLKDISEWIKIPSVSHTPGAIEALKWGLKKGEEMGFKAESFHNHTSGHLILGDKNADYVGILGHVDVVPVDESEWDDNPYSGKIDDKFIYGRGTQDDKGPLMIAFYALKIIKDLNLPIKKSVKIIMGTEEEDGDWDDIANYFKSNPAPVCGFTPDANFPLIFAEKHILQMSVKGNMMFKKIKSFTAGNAVNSVPSEAVIELSISEDEIKELLKDFKPSEGITIKVENQKIIFKGKAAHSKDAHLGISAAYAMVDFISKIEEHEFITDLIQNHTHDPFVKKPGWEAKGEDGDFTINMGMLSFKNGKFEGKFDMRVPNKVDLLKVEVDFKTLWRDYDVSRLSITEGLFKSKEDSLIKVLEKAYRDVTKDTKTPLKTTGGGTYAKAAPNTVAFGPLFPDDEPTLHQKNEKFAIKSILNACEIYCKAIYDLIK